MTVKSKYCFGETITDNIVKEKSKNFAVRIVYLCRFLKANRAEFVLADQILRSGTSIGANIRESVRAQSAADFYSKLNIALKEAEETAYWLELLYETGTINETEYNSLHNDCNELICLLVSITKNKK